MAMINGKETFFAAVGAAGGGIKECDTLPTENIKTNTLYKIPAGLFWYDEFWHQLIDSDDIVVPDTDTSNRGTAGLVHLYNESSGLRLDDNKRMCIAAATKDEIKAKKSVNKPLVPYYLDEAIKAGTYQDDLASITSASETLPASAKTVQEFVLKNALNFKLHKIPRGGTFEITPGMMALILPYGDYTLSAHKADGTTVAEKMGATIAMATDWGADTEDKNNYWVAFMYVKTATLMPTMSSNHTSYTDTCYIKNNDSGTSGTGYAYVYYISRGE